MQPVAAAFAGQAADEALALCDEGGFTALKLRLGRDDPCEDDAAMHAVRKGVGDRCELMDDDSEGLNRAVALRRCGMVDDLGLARMRIGGVTDRRRSAAIAGAAGAPMSTHLYPEVAARMMRVMESAHWLDWQDWLNPLLGASYTVQNRRIEIPYVVGVGLEWNEETVAAHLV
jgi:mandelate racemase